MNCDSWSPQRGYSSFLNLERTAPVYYPPKALKLGIEGIVKVQFVVIRFGKLLDAWVMQSPSPLLNKEALAAIYRTKKWSIYYKEDCKAINVVLIQPITFRI